MQILLGEDAQPVRFGAWLQKSVLFCNVPLERKSELLRLENVNFMLVLCADLRVRAFAKKYTFLQRWRSIRRVVRRVLRGIGSLREAFGMLLRRRCL